MSASKVRAIVSEILEPVMTKVHEDGAAARAAKRGQQLLEDRQGAITNKMNEFQARTHKFDELYTKVMKVDAELTTYQAHVNGQWTNITNKCDIVVNESARIRKEHEIEKAKVQKFEQKMQAYEQQFDAVNKQLNERFKMMEQDVDMFKYRVNSLLQGFGGQLTSYQFEQEEARKQNTRIEAEAHMQKDRMRELARQIGDLEVRKTDYEEFCGVIRPYQSQLDKMDHRLSQDETEKKGFAMYIVRYLPVMIQNEIVALTKDTMTGEMLVKMKERLEAVNEMVDAIPEKRHNVIANIAANKIAIVDRFKQLYDYVLGCADQRAMLEEDQKARDQ
jgi:hypothetical protein